MIDESRSFADDHQPPNRPDVGEMAKGIAGVARDAGYVAVGFGVLGLQKALVHREALQQASAARC